jgi:hypothetical protein
MAQGDDPQSQRTRKVAELRAKQDAQRRKRLFGIVAVAVVLVATSAAAAVVAHRHEGHSASSTPTPTTGSSTAAPSGKPGPESIPLEAGADLASLSGAATGAVVDGIKCDESEQVAYHIHVHLAVYVNGTLTAVPAGIGIVAPILTPGPQGSFASATKCYYWLHTHATDGVIHIESPTEASYTLGQFFDIWGQPLAAGQAGPAHGPLTVFVNGASYTGDPRAIPLHSHDVIQIDVGNPATAPAPVDWSVSTL